jgi:ribosomal protein S26
MGKLIAWLVLIFIVLLALRLINQRKSRRQRRAGAAGSTQVEPMVRCTRCGVFLPRADATQRAGEYACPDGQCVKR